PRGGRDRRHRRPLRRAAREDAGRDRQVPGRAVRGPHARPRRQEQDDPARRADQEEKLSPMPRAAVLGLLIAWGSAAPALGGPEAEDLAAALTAGLDVVGASADVVVVDLPAAPGAARVRCATLVKAAPATIKEVLLDTAHYRMLIPALIRSDVEPGA